MKAILLVFVVLCFGLVAEAKLRKVQRVQQNERAQIQAGINAWLSYNYDFANTFKQQLEALKVPAADIQPIMNIVAIRNARFEAGVGLASQTQAGMLDALKTTLNRAICIQKTAFPGKNADDLMGSLFALPGSFNGADEKTWTDAKGEKWPEFDYNRWGPFLQHDSRDLKTHIANVNRVLSSGNYRELLHLIARMSLYGEHDAVKDVDNVGTVAPHSFRHALVILVKDAALSAQAVKDCHLDLTHLQNQYRVNKNAPKTLIQPVPSSSVNDARAPKGGNFRGPRFPRQDNAKKPDFGKTPNTRLTANLLAAMHMPALSKEEQAYMTVKGWDGKPDTKPAFGVGGNVWKVSRTDAKDQGNAPWFDAMTQDGLIMDAGPSGTTDEIMQFGDYTSVTTKIEDTCKMRSAPFAQMLLQVHHSFAEVCQGANDGHRASPQWSFAKPYNCLTECKGDYFENAFKSFKSLDDENTATFKAIKTSDFGSVGNDVRTVFEKSKETATDYAKVQQHLCPLTDKFPGGAEMKRILCA